MLGTRRRFNASLLAREKIAPKDAPTFSGWHSQYADSTAGRPAAGVADDDDDDDAMCAAADAAERRLAADAASAHVTSSREGCDATLDRVTQPPNHFFGLPLIEVTLSFAQAQAALNMRPEVTETLLCYAESAELLRITGQRYGTVELTFTADHTPSQLALHSDVVAAVATLSRRALAAAASAQARQKRGDAFATSSEGSANLRRLLDDCGASAPRKDSRGRTVLRASLDAIVVQLQSRFVMAASAALARLRLSGDGNGGPHMQHADDVSALRLQRVCNHGHALRELLELQSAGRLVVALSDWGVGVAQVSSWGVPASSATGGSIESTTVSASALGLLHPRLEALAGPVLGAVARSLHERMVRSAAFGVDRLTQSFELLNGAALSSWQHLWPRSKIQALDPTSGMASPMPPPLDGASSDDDAGLPCSMHDAWKSREVALLQGIDAYCSASPATICEQTPNQAPPSSTSDSTALGSHEERGHPAALTSTTSRFPVLQVSRRELPALATDIRTTVRRMRDILQQVAAEVLAGVPGAVDGSSFFSSADCDVWSMRAVGHEKPSASREVSGVPGNSPSSPVPVHQLPPINALAVARVLHGVSTPLFSWTEFKPAGMGRSRLAMLYGGVGGIWGKYAGYDFGHVAECACRILGVMDERQAPLLVPPVLRTEPAVANDVRGPLEDTGMQGLGAD